MVCSAYCVHSMYIYVHTVESVSSVGWQGIELITSVHTPATNFNNPNCSAITPSVDGGAQPPKPLLPGPLNAQTWSGYIERVCMLHYTSSVCTCVNASYDDILYLCCTPRLYCNRRMYESLLKLRGSGSDFQRSGRIQQQSDYAEVSNLLFTYI